MNFQHEYQFIIQYDTRDQRRSTKIYLRHHLNAGKRHVFGVLLRHHSLASLASILRVVVAIVNSNVVSAAPNLLPCPSAQLSWLSAGDERIKKT